MKRSTDHILHSLKDGFRTVRYTIRAEADTPGAMLPKAVGNIDLAPFIAVGSTMGKPALRALDGLLTQVEALAGGVIKPHDEAPSAYPADVATFFDSQVAFSAVFYDVYKRLLLARGAKNILLSEHAFDDAQARFRARHGDIRRSGASPAQASAGLTCALAEARPIRKLDLHTGAPASPHLMLAPNIVCATFVGLTVALVTRDPSLKRDLDGLEESVGSVVDARFDRFKRAMSGKSPVADLAAQFEAVLTFMP